MFLKLVVGEKNSWPLVIIESIQTSGTHPQRTLLQEIAATLKNYIQLSGCPKCSGTEYRVKGYMFRRVGGILLFQLIKLIIEPADGRADLQVELLVNYWDVGRHKFDH